MAIRIPWNEQEALLLFDAYEKIQSNPDKKTALASALSVNLRRMAVDNGISIDNTFRNLTGISMRLSEIDKILHPDHTGLTKTSELFYTVAELYTNHRKTFLKKLQDVEEYRVNILADMVGFDFLESVVLLDAYLGISASGVTKAHIARVTSEKLRNLAVNRGRIINEAFRSSVGILGRLKKMEIAFQNIPLEASDVPRVFVDAVKLYHKNRAEYNRLLECANSIMGAAVLSQGLMKTEKAKQQVEDAVPIKKTPYFKTKTDRKLYEAYPNEYVAVYKALEQRSYTDSDGITASDLFHDIKKKYQRNAIIHILDGCSWSKEIRAGKYVHVLGAAEMAMQESNENKFFAWLGAKIAPAQCKEMQRAKGSISMLLMLKKVIKQPLFSMDSADEVVSIINKVAPCFANYKTKKIAIQMVSMYATYLKEQTLAPSKDDNTPAESLPISKCGGERIYSLHVGDKVYSGERPSIAFALFCEEMAVTYPLKIRSMVGLRIHGKADIPIKINDDGNCVKIANVKAYVDNKMLIQQAEEYAHWLCKMCGIKSPNISVDVEPTATIVQDVPMVDHTAVSDQDSKPFDMATNPVKLSVSVPEKPAVEVVPQRPDPLLEKMEQIVLRADMDGMSYDDLKDTLQITMVLTKQMVAQFTKIVDIKGVLIHEEAFIDWEDGAEALETIIEKLMQKNNGYISSTQLFEYARIEMNMFLNDNDMREERAVYDMAQHLFEKVHYHGKTYSFRGKTHISRADAGIGSNMDIYKKYATDQGGLFNFNGLVEYLESIGVGTGNLRTQMRMQTEPIFFYYAHDIVVYADALHIDDDWKKSIKKSLDVLFDDAGDHVILRNIPSIWFDRLPAISGNHPWTPLLLQSVIRFYGKEFGAKTIQALDGQSIETLHTMLVTSGSPIQDFGDVVISFLLEQNIERRKFEAEELRLLLVDGGILHGNELIWNMPKALKQDVRFAWDASGNIVAVKI